MRKPNTTCCNCSNSIYKRPYEIAKGNVYCSVLCSNISKGMVVNKSCLHCSKVFKPDRQKTKFCSHTCANTSRRGIIYNKESKGNKSRLRLDLLKNVFEFKSCMVKDCKYDKTYDIHRHIAGKDGGEYIIGNMFAICPNHHAEVTRGLIKFHKINNMLLKII